MHLHGPPAWRAPDAQDADDRIGNRGDGLPPLI